MYKNASKPSLNVIAGSPLRVLSYKTFDTFQQDQSQVRLRLFCHSTLFFSINQICNFGQWFISQWTNLLPDRPFTRKIIKWTFYQTRWKNFDWHMYWRRLVWLKIMFLTVSQRSFVWCNRFRFEFSMESLIRDGPNARTKISQSDFSNMKFAKKINISRD